MDQTPSSQEFSAAQAAQSPPQPPPPPPPPPQTDNPGKVIKDDSGRQQK
ncbi:MAG: hypothetical protein ACRERE_16920 [Candidatus Entotheonellia bacterium]